MLHIVNLMPDINKCHNALHLYLIFRILDTIYTVNIS
jgi:hypothetical protein